jgi:hypothetical protein
MIPNVLGWNIRGRTLESQPAEAGFAGPGFYEVRSAAAITVSSIAVEQPALTKKKIVTEWFAGRFHLIQSTMVRLVRVQDVCT